MQKLILLSLLVATIAIPVMAANSPSPRRGLKRAVFFFFVFNVCYLIAVLYLYPRFFAGA